MPLGVRRDRPPSTSPGGYALRETISRTRLPTASAIARDGQSSTISDGTAFHCEQTCFDGDATERRKTVQTAGANDAMTWNDQRNWISRHDATNGPRGARRSTPSRKLTISHGRAKRNTLASTKDFTLKWRCIPQVDFNVLEFFYGALRIIPDTIHQHLKPTRAVTFNRQFDIGSEEFFHRAESCHLTVSPKRQIQHHCWIGNHANPTKFTWEHFEKIPNLWRYLGLRVTLGGR